MGTVAKHLFVATVATLATGAVAVPLVAGASAPPSSEPATSEAAGSATATETMVWIPGGDHPIPGTLSLPAGANADTPVVLMLHGFASQRDEVGNMYLDEAAALADEGIASLRIDFPGSGDSLQGTLDLTYDVIGEDAVRAYDWLASGDAGQDFSSVSALGFSMGGHAVASLVAERPDVAAAALWNGSVEDHTGREVPAEAIADGHILQDLGFTLWDSSLAYYESAVDSTALTDLSTFAGPVLVVHGAEDTVVPGEVADGVVEALEANGNEAVTRLDIDGADHIFLVLTEDHGPSRQVIADTAAWFADNT